MLRFRRYRVFLVFAGISIVALYHFTSVRNWETGSSISVEGLKNFGLQGTSRTPSTIENVFKETEHAVPTLSTISSAQSSIVVLSVPSITESAQKLPATTSSGSTGSSYTNTNTVLADHGNGIQEETSGLATDGTTTDTKVPLVNDNLLEQGQGRLEVGPVNTSITKNHWRKLQEHFPVPSEFIIPLPTGKPNLIPKIQHAFTDESSNSKIDRERKLASIKEAFTRSWGNYKQHAWLQDELSPVSGKFRNPFCGWAATLVDSLDALWILGMQDEFEEAANAVKQIDFTTSIRNDIPLFETTIRYLGGFIAAYDLSEGRYKVLLDKSIELAEVLMGAFDTPNRMPVTFYQWKPAFASQPHRASTRVVLAELGSLSLEFTRLAQITKDAKYYDAVARITNELERWQNNTKLPGMWPISIDASGCKKSEVRFTTPVEHSRLNGPQNLTAQFPQVPPASIKRSSTGLPVQLAAEALVQTSLQLENNDKDDRILTRQSPVASSTGQSITDMAKRQLLDATLANSTNPMASAKTSAFTLSDTECQMQGLASPPKIGAETFTLGGMSDSVYEYLPKEYMLLGGLNDQYRTMFQQSLDAVKKHLLFRPMTPKNRNVLFLGTVTSKGYPELADNMQLKPEGQHLTCFAGGMFAIGARIFDRPEDLEIAAKLTDGCVWAYESTTTGIMPEGFIVVPCPNINDCPWNETLYMEALDPNREYRDRQREQQEQSILAQQREDESLDGVELVESAILSKLPAAATTMPEQNHDLGNRLTKKELRDMDSPLPTAVDSAIKAASGLAPMPANKQSDAEPLQVDDSHTRPSPIAGSIAGSTATVVSSAATKSSVTPASAYTPPSILTHEEFATTRIENERLPKGFTSIWSRKYILRPEAIESVFIMYRTTGNDYWREKGWQMFTAIQNYTRVEFGNSAIGDVTSSAPGALDEMESFWLAETLKYFYLLFSDPEVVSLDDYVLNTEAHPFRRPK
ncbi:MAG: hypothetical protein M1830_009172 [Pleopsidium flavum]|nr:MAG: hypothetical protein M1830_009172 [Pleopsidium flavum]